jgi:hypothetical protein
LRRRNQDQAVELVLLVGVLRRHQMTEMNGIETPAEKSNFHRAQRGIACADRQGSSGSTTTDQDERFAAGARAKRLKSPKPGLTGMPFEVPAFCW